jgi:L-serine/L-threonine ammonia-lyase
VVRTGQKPDAIVLSVGGGGLLAGIAEGLHRNGWDDIPIIAVETEGAASFHQAVKAGHPVQLAEITSIATSLGAKRVCEKSVQWAKDRS